MKGFNAFSVLNDGNKFALFKYAPHAKFARMLIQVRYPILRSLFGHPNQHSAKHMHEAFQCHLECPYIELDALTSLPLF